LAEADWLPLHCAFRVALEVSERVIIGNVNAYREAIVHLKVRGPEGSEQGVAAIVDTGFNGWLTLPSPLITTLNLPFRGRGAGTMADGSEALFDIHEATVVWDGQPRLVPVYAVESEPLLGMDFFYGDELTIQVVEGGSVAIKKLS